MKKAYTIAVLALLMLASLPYGMAALEVGAANSRSEVKAQVQVKDTDNKIPKVDSRIPKDCALWYDGCNECKVSNGEIQSCTKRQCIRHEEEKCLIYFDDTRVKEEGSYDTASVSYNEAKERYTDARDELAIVKIKSQSCRDSTEECMQTKAQVQAKSKIYLEHSADKVVAILERVSARIEDSAMPEDQKEEVLAKIAVQIESAQEIKANISAGEDGNASKIRKDAQDLKRAALEAKKEANFALHGLMNSKLLNVISRFEGVEANIGVQIAYLEQQGYDTTHLANLTAEMSAYIDSAAEHQAKAKEYFSSRSINETRAEIKAAQGDLRQAHTVLKEIMRQIREARAEISVNETIEADAEVEA